MAEEVKTEDVLAIALVSAVVAAGVAAYMVMMAIFNMMIAVVAAIYNVMTSWWALPIVVGIFLLCGFLYERHQEQKRQELKWQRQERQRLRQERQRQQEEAERRRYAEYCRAYDAFAFVLKHSPKEARGLLEQLSVRFPDLLKKEARLEKDFEELLRQESGDFEARLRERLGL